MEDERKSKGVNKYLIKVELFLLKIFPIIISICYFSSSILSYMGVNTMPFMYVSGLSLLPIIFMYISSHAFNFCAFHRVFIHYIVVNNIIKMFHHFRWFGVTDSFLFRIHIIVAILTVIIGIIVYVKDHKRTSPEDS